MCDNHNTIEMPFNMRKIWNDQFGPPDNPPQIDACIAYDVWKMVTIHGIHTINSCCGHGRKLRDDEGQVMIDDHAIVPAIKAGYDVRVFHRIWERDDGAEHEAPTYEIRLDKND